MINESKLKEICDTYKIDYDKLVNNNENVLKNGEYYSICYVLDFLRDELNIEPRNIEKCPSILYRNIENIKSNYEFLKNEQITKYSVEGCLHILSTEPTELKRTYQYIMQNYGIRYLNARTTILRIPVDRIKNIEIKFPELKKKNVLQAAYSRRTIEEIEKIIEVCKKNKIEITGSVFQRTAEEIEEIVNACRENGIEPTGNVFYRSAEEIEKIIEVCKKNKIEITGSVFQRTAEEIEEIVNACRENGIEPTGNVFFQSADEIEKIIKVCQANGIELTGSVFKSTPEELEKIIKVCKTNGIEPTGTVFSRSAEEIEKIIKVCKENGIEPTGTVFSRSAEEIEKIIKVCKENGIEPTGTVFSRSAEEIEKIIKVCKENGIELTGNVFKKTSEEIKEIVKVCKENKVEITGSIFFKSAKQLQENIEYIRENYGDEYLKPLIITRNIKNLKLVLPYLQEIGVLKVLPKSASILSLTLDEITEREKFIESIGESVLNTYGTKFNSIFGLSRKKYAQRVEKEKSNQVEL